MAVGCHQQQRNQLQIAPPLNLFYAQRVQNFDSNIHAGEASYKAVAEAERQTTTR